VVWAGVGGCGGGGCTSFKTLPEIGYPDYGFTEPLRIAYIIIYATVTSQHGRKPSKIEKLGIINILFAQ
jgi:hypothetical protein